LRVGPQSVKPQVWWPLPRGTEVVPIGTAPPAMRARVCALARPLRPLTAIGNPASGPATVPSGRSRGSSTLRNARSHGSSARTRAIVASTTLGGLAAIAGEAWVAAGGSLQVGGGDARSGYRLRGRCLASPRPAWPPPPPSRSRTGPRGPGSRSATERAPAQRPCRRCPRSPVRRSSPASAPRTRPSHRGGDRPRRSRSPTPRVQRRRRCIPASRGCQTSPRSWSRASGCSAAARSRSLRARRQARTRGQGMARSRSC
jgi:hypothetical protein